jgi:hypothetical protein
MSILNGTIVLTSLPPHRGVIIDFCFYAVNGPDAPAPYNGDPPAEAATDCLQVFKQVDLNTESQQTTYDLTFRVERPVGWYYVAVRAILFRKEGEKVFAQVEQFFFGRRPLPFVAEGELSVTFPVAWPTQAVEELHSYGTMHPRSSPG